MITFRNAESIHSRAEALGAIVQGDNFPLHIQMPCRFRIRKGEQKEQGKAGDFLIFDDYNTPRIATEPETLPEMETDITLKPSRKK